MQLISTVQLREELIQYIKNADERFLKMVQAMSKEYDKDAVAGYNTDGTAISKKMLIKRVKQASAEVKSGKFISQEDIEKEIENW